MYQLIIFNSNEYPSYETAEACNATYTTQSTIDCIDHAVLNGARNTQLLDTIEALDTFAKCIGVDLDDYTAGVLDSENKFVCIVNPPTIYNVVGMSLNTTRKYNSNLVHRVNSFNNIPLTRDSLLNLDDDNLRRQCSPLADIVPKFEEIGGTPNLILRSELLRIGNRIFEKGDTVSFPIAQHVMADSVSVQHIESLDIINLDNGFTTAIIPVSPVSLNQKDSITLLEFSKDLATEIHLANTLSVNTHGCNTQVVLNIKKGEV